MRHRSRVRAPSWRVRLADAEPAELITTLRQPGTGIAHRLLMSDDFVIAEGGEEGGTVAFIDAQLAKEATPTELDSFRMSARVLVGRNVGSSMFMMTDAGPVATFLFARNYTPHDRAKVERWLRSQALVRRITFDSGWRDRGLPRAAARVGQQLQDATRRCYGVAP